MSGAYPHRACILIWHAGAGNSEGIAETSEWPAPAGTCSVEVLAKASRYTSAGPLEVPAGSARVVALNSLPPSNAAADEVFHSKTDRASDGMSTVQRGFAAV